MGVDEAGGDEVVGVGVVLVVEGGVDVEGGGEEEELNVEELEGGGVNEEELVVIEVELEAIVNCLLKTSFLGCLRSGSGSRDCSSDSNWSAWVFGW